MKYNYLLVMDSFAKDYRSRMFGISPYLAYVTHRFVTLITGAKRQAVILLTVTACLATHAYAAPGPYDTPALKSPWFYSNPGQSLGCHSNESSYVSAALAEHLKADICETWDTGALTSWPADDSAFIRIYYNYYEVATSSNNIPAISGGLTCWNFFWFETGAIPRSSSIGLMHMEHRLRERSFTYGSSCEIESTNNRLIVRRGYYFYCPEDSYVVNHYVNDLIVPFCRPHYYVAAAPNNCPAEGNPCNPATGNKYQVETDIPAKGVIPGFTRYYNSQGGNGGFKALGAGWSHNYRQQLDAGIADDYQQLSGIKSSTYRSSSRACSDGWKEIRNRAFRGQYATNSATERNGVCQIVGTNVRLRLRPTLNVPPIADTHEVSRPNGKTLTFIQEAGGWVDMNGASINLTPLTDGWQFEDRNGMIETFDSNGNLRSTTDRNKQTTTYSYTADGRLEQVIGPMGHILAFAYNPNGLLQSVTAPDNRIYRYAYDELGNLANVIYPDETEGDLADNPRKIYHYEDTRFPHHLTGITDEKGVRYATWAYDAEGRAIVSEHAGGAERVVFAYNDDGTTTVTDAAGAERIYHFEVQQGAMKVSHIEGDRCTTCANGGIQSYTYDDHGNIASKTDWNGNVTIYARDERGRELSRTVAAGTPEARTITTRWDTVLNKPLIVTEPGQITEYTYDPDGRLLTRRQRAQP